MEEVKEHVANLLQKCLISTVICIIKCKPKHMSTIDFCKSIQTKIKQENINNFNTDEGIFTEEIQDNESTNNILADLCKEMTIDAEERPSQLITSEAKERTRVNLKIISSIKEIKSAISNFKGLQISESQMSQDSAYQSGRGPSQTYSNEGYVVERTLNKIDESLEVLVDFLSNMSDDPSQNHLYKCISHIVSEIIDILFDRNIYLPTFNKISDIIEEKIDCIINTSDDYMGLVWKSKLKSLYALNKSPVFIQYSLAKLMKSLDDLLHRLKVCDEVILEFDNPEYVDRTFFVFHLIEDLLVEYYSIRNKSEMNQEVAVETELDTDKIKSSNAFSKNWNLPSDTSDKKNCMAEFENRIMDVLNQVVLDCVDSYPLFSFWALECIKIKNIK
ncbi:uncharacterized protein LOC143919165 [Arctopsyche grandis]|uniref:uncharacterized protein LOC143919165 n=1 Tax=Arctopsyche grandis TaxID=121162 RepID=UPI00406D7E95